VTGRALIDRTARVVITAGLATDAYVHAHLASTYDAVRTRTVSQGDLFRAEAVVAAITAVTVLLWRHRVAVVAAFGVAAGGLSAVLIYRYVNVGAIGPLPSMYEPAWYTDKTVSAIAEAGATLASAIALLNFRRAVTQPVRVAVADNPSAADNHPAAADNHPAAGTPAAG